MNPWITGRIIEQMQREARTHGEQERLGHRAHTHGHSHAPATPVAEDRVAGRARIGLAVARLGLRVAGRANTPAVVRAAAVAPPEIDPQHWSNPWTTCGATSTSSH